MKTIVETSTGLSKYLLSDDTVVTVRSNQIDLGPEGNLDLIIGDLNSGNATVHENVTNAPEDWFGNKYTFDGTTWTVNPDWVDPDA